VTHVEARPSHHVGHEGVARDEVARAEGDRKRVEVRRVAVPGAALGQFVLDRPGQAPAYFERLRVGLGRQPPPARKLTQQLEQLQIRPRPRLAFVDRRLGNGHRAAPDGVTQRALELPERRLLFGDAAEVVLIEVEQRG
jgi:hypothetical protein